MHLDVGDETECQPSCSAARATYHMFAATLVSDAELKTARSSCVVPRGHCHSPMPVSQRLLIASLTKMRPCTAQAARSSFTHSHLDNQCILAADLDSQSTIRQSYLERVNITPCRSSHCYTSIDRNALSRAIRRRWVLILWGLLRAPERKGRAAQEVPCWSPSD